MSRSTPAYRLSRRQAPHGDYSVQCRLMCGEPYLGGGDEFQSHVIGKVPWTQGTAVLSLAYKTRPHMCPRRVEVTPSEVFITDDYYDNTGPKPPLPHSVKENVNKPDVVPQFEGISSCSVKPKRAAFASETENDEQSIPADISTDIPFASLLQCAPVATVAKTSQDIPQREADLLQDLAKLGLSHDSVESTHSREDFVLLELRAPFAGQEEDLGRFYRECQAAPALSMFEANSADPISSLGDTAARDAASSITEQLAKFEANADEFTEFINSLQEVDT